MAATMMVVLMNGCQSKYEPIEIGTKQETIMGADTQKGAHGLSAQVDNLNAQTNSPTIQVDNGVVPASNMSLGPSVAQVPTTSSEDAGTGAPMTIPAEIPVAEASITVTQPATTFTDVEEIVYVTGNQVNVRASYSTSSEVITSLNKGASVKRTGYSESWSRVIYGDKECYISSQYLSAAEPETQAPTQAVPIVSGGEVKLNSAWKYADFSKINSGAAILYKSDASNYKGITVCVNAGHGTKGGSSVSTLCHPDGSAKVTGGTTAAGATTAVAVSAGMTFNDGTAEPKVTLALALKLKAKLLAAGYDVLMIRESDDVQLDNVARTVIANNMADCHIALHWDSTTNNKGAFYMSVPGNSSYRSMEPVKSHWQQHNALGESLIGGLREAGVKIFSGGSMEMDLTQTSYSTIPSIDIELGDKASDHSDATLDILANGLLNGINAYFK